VGYLCTWPDPKPLSEQEQALVALNWTKTYATYAAAAGRPIEQIIPVEMWLEDTCGWTKEQIERMTALIEETMADIAAEEADPDPKDMPDEEAPMDEAAA
jgi:hypothetical protein